MKRFIATFFLAGGLLISVPSFADCTALIDDAVDWASQTSGSYSYYVGFTMTSMKAPAKFVHYSEGAFTAYRGSLQAQRVGAYFSDRSWCPELTPGGFCTNYQKFDHRKQDQMTFSLYRTGVLRVILNTWGNATYSVNLQCSNGFLYGTMVEPNGNSFITLNLKKYKMDIPR